MGPLRGSARVRTYPWPLLLDHVRKTRRGTAHRALLLLEVVAERVGRADHRVDEAGLGVGVPGAADELELHGVLAEARGHERRLEPEGRLRLAHVVAAAVGDGDLVAVLGL